MVNNIEGLTVVQEANVNTISVVHELGFHVKHFKEARYTRAASHEPMWSTMQYVLSMKMPLIGISDFARDRDMADRSVVRCISGGAFHENRNDYSPTPVVKDTSR